MQIHQTSTARGRLPTAPLLTLPARQQMFVEQYFIDLKARDTAIRTGYAPISAHVTASRLLDDPKVRNAISQELASRFDVSKESVVNELAAIAFAQLGNYVSGTDTTFSVRPSRSLTYNQRKAVVMIKPRGRNGLIVEVRLANKLKSIELLAKMLAMLDNTHARQR